MNKYLSIFKISFAQEFAYKLNFIMWRLRNVIQILVTFFLWDSIFASPGRAVFGYTREKILTYVFGTIVVKAFVFSSRAQDVANEIASGEISMYLTKPINYFKYYLTRDFSSKALNIVFAFFETLLLVAVFKPEFYFQKNLGLLLLFVLICILAMTIYFFIVFLVSMIPFWKPEIAWGGHFLITMIVAQFLSGALFPMDIFPKTFQNILNLTPFPYLIFFPIKAYLGEIPFAELIKGTLISGVWVFLLYLITTSVWKKGLKVYEAQGQ